MKFIKIVRENSKNFGITPVELPSCLFFLILLNYLVMVEHIFIKGAREHNLKNIDVKIPRNKFVVITGISGSGKSSLAFDTLYAEGQRRYVESLSAYARQFLGIMEKPNIDYIEGLSPAISIEQRTSSKNPRSTVGTVTEIYDYLRVLFARIGTPYCYKCGRKIEAQTPQQIVDKILELENDTKIQILAPLVRGRKGEFKELFKKARKEGFVRVRVDGEIKNVEDKIQLDKNKKHTVEAVVDRIVVDRNSPGRLTDSVETALKIGEGILLVDIIGGEEQIFSEKFSCIECGISYEELSPRMFSFNSPYGACPICGGLGTMMKIDPELVVRDKNKSIAEGAIRPWKDITGTWYSHILRSLAENYDFDLFTPWYKLNDKAKNVILFGSGKEEIKFRYSHRNRKGGGVYIGKFEGIINNLQRRYKETTSMGIRSWIESFMNVSKCQECEGSRLRPESRAVRIGDMNIGKLTSLSIKDTLRFFENLKLDKKRLAISHQVLKEVKSRLGFMINVGLDYLTLDRTTSTLSGGESQRIRLATQIGSQLVGVLYILDEPSIGLHHRDNRRLINTLKKLKDLGNTVLVVEHDRDTIESSDWVIDLGPGAGNFGGNIVTEGTPEFIKKTNNSLTGAYLSRKKKIPIPEKRKIGNGKYLLLKGAKGNNLKSIDVKFPLGCFTAITGVSGSGKSTLINETLYRILARRFYKSRTPPLQYESLDGIENIDKVIEINQSPIGRTPRSNPATYTGVFTYIRDLFSKLPEAKIRGYKPGRFSFNVKGGRCEACQGDGIKKIEMHFLPDVYITCETCKGKRYNRETLEIKYKGKSIADVLDMTVMEALEFFSKHTSIQRKLQTLYDVGLGYIKLGQQATTLSGGEAQRVKLSTELSKVGTGNTLYILDEPTTGLHFEDVNMLLNVLNRLVNKGNTVLVIEHNLDVIKTADYIIDLGPEGGDDGGYIVAEGAPEDIVKNSKSYTGKYLMEELLSE